jgi:hypothetical protein
VSQHKLGGVSGLRDALSSRHLIGSILAELGRISHDEQIGLELTGGAGHLEGRLAGEHGNGEQRPASIDLSVVDLRSDGSLSLLVEVEHTTVAALKPETRHISNVTAERLNISGHRINFFLFLYIETIRPPTNEVVQYRK